MPGFSKVAILSGLVALAAAQQPEWGQCGGIGWTGATTCASPWVCTVINAYYYQCLPASSSATTATPTTTNGQTTSHTTTTPVGTVTGGLKSRFGSRYYGAALASSNFGDSSYTALAKANIDMATAENECKFDATEPSNGGYSYSGCDTVYNFVSGLGGKFRGHNLVWHQQVPSWVNSLSGSAVQSAMVAHIQNLLAYYKGKFYCWDVVNEAFADSGGYNSSPWYTAMGANFINIAFQTARTADPNVKLYYNDYNIEYSGGKSTNAYNLVKSLKSSNIIDGVGFEAHYIVGQTPNSASTAASFVALGVEFAYTELDIRMPTPASSANLAQQSVDYANVVSYCIGNSACVGVTTWGLTDKYSWIPGTFSGQGAALPWDSNYSPKPAYTGIYNAA